MSYNSEGNKLNKMRYFDLLDIIGIKNILFIYSHLREEYNGGKWGLMQSKIILLIDCEFNTLSERVQKEIYNEFYKFVYGAIIFIVKEHAATEDIIQESFLKIIRSVPELDGENKLKAWIKVVVRNTVFNYLKKQKKIRNEVDVDSIFINDSINFATTTDTIHTEIELKEMINVVEKYLNQLKPEYKILIELRWKKEMSYKEIAAYLEINEPLVKVKLHRARESIKQKMITEWGDVK